MFKSKAMALIVALFFITSLSLAQYDRDAVIEILYPDNETVVDTDFVEVDFYLAPFFAIGDSGCTDCDGYIQAFLNDEFYGNINTASPALVSGLSDGPYFLELVVVNSSGVGFTPALGDTTSFMVDILSQADLCPPRNLEVIAGDGRNFLNWTPPAGGMSGDIGCGDFLVTSIPFNTSGVTTGMGNDWELTGSNNDDVAYTLNLSDQTIIDVTLCDPGSNYDTKLAIFTGCPDDGTADEIYYNDDDFTCTVSGLRSSIFGADLAPGQYYIVVDGFSTSNGSYVLDITEVTTRNENAIDLRDALANETHKMLIEGFSEEDVETLIQEYRALTWRNYSREIDPACGTFLHYSIVDANTGTEITTADTNLYIHEGLTNDTEYCYEIVAVYSEGSSVATEVVCATPELYIPAPPTNLAAVGYDEEVFLSWTSPDVQQLGIPYSEDFSSQLVELWTWEGENWSIYDFTGNPPPSAQFSWIPSQANYDLSLYSPFVPLDGYTDVIVTFDMYLDMYSDTGEEFLTIEYLNGGTWNLLREFVNTADIPWATYTDTLSGVSGSIRLRFRAHGIDSFNLNYWYIDNVNIDGYVPTRDMTGSTVFALDEYIGGARQVINFNLVLTAPDGAYCDMFEITFPAGITVNGAGPELLGTGGSIYPPEAYNGVNGQTVSWGTDNNDQAGGIYGTLPFWVDLTFDPSVSGPVTCDFLFSDDAWGNQPLDATGTVDILERTFVDGELLGYNIYIDGSTTPDNDFTIGDRFYTATELINGVEYDFEVTASYYPDYESTPASASATPTWLFGDIAGVVTDPADNLLDSAIVSVGGLSDTTGIDGAYMIYGLVPGVHTVNVSRPGFDGTEADVTVIAQEAAVEHDFMMIPKLGIPMAVEAFGGDHLIDLQWRAPGAMAPGEWMLFHDGSFENSISSTDGGMGLAQLFIPPGYPATIQAVRFHVSEFGSFDQEIEVNVFDAVDGFTVLSGPYFVNGVSNDWIEIDIDDATIDAGAFLVATYNTLPGGPYISIDEDNDSHSLFFGSAVDGWTDMADYGYFAEGSHEALIAASGRSFVIRNNDTVEEISDFNADLPVSLISSAGTHGPTAPHPTDLSRTESTRDDSLVGYNVYQIFGLVDSLVASTESGDTTATIMVDSNYVEYCFKIKAIWETDLYDTLESKPSGVACTETFKPGDVDFSDDVSITDLTMVVDFVLGLMEPTVEQFRGSDINRDEMINIQDVILMVDLIFGTPVARYSAGDGSESATLSLTVNNGTMLNLALSSNVPVRGLQFTVESTASSIQLGSPSILGANGELLLAGNTNASNQVTYVIARIDGQALDLRGEVLATIPFTVKGQSREMAEISLNNSRLAGFNGVSIPVTERSTVIDFDVMPSSYALHQNYPNPFNPETDIKFDLPDAGLVQLVIYNITGQKIRTLVSDNLEAGFHQIRWNGTNEYNEPVATGMYFYQLTAGNYHATKKMVILK